MAKHIAITGKGGTGKTTISSLMIRYLVENTKGSILAVDADANANLNEALGLEVEHSISSILLDVKKSKVPTGMTKNVYIQMMLHKALIEEKRFDLLVMGGPEGPGCYCFPNELLSREMESLDQNYNYMVIDNEAGMEHISRQTIKDIDILLVISDASARGVRSARRINELVKALNIQVGKAYLIVTKTDDPEALQKEIAATGLDLLGTIPNDPLVAKYDLQGTPLVTLPEDSAAWRAAKKMFEKIPDLAQI